MLVLDVGNSRITIGIFENRILRDKFSIPTNRVGDLCSISEVKPQKCLVSSVVPEVNELLVGLVRATFQIEPVIFDPAKNAPIKISVDGFVGADRVINAFAALRLYGAPVLSVDLGTATTFDLVNPRGEFVGGAIAPGLKISLDALTQSTSQLPKIELEHPNRLVGKTTEEAMKSGVFLGYAALVDGLIDKFKKEEPSLESVVLTGGLASFLSPLLNSKFYVETDLTLIGLAMMGDEI
jgi:type III pantothenate kinase